MPEIKRTGLSGTCNGAYFYDLGGAHGKFRSRDLEQFAFKLCEIGMNSVNIAVTNDGQTTERKYLSELGWTKTKIGTRMYVHTISNTDLEKALAPYKEIKQKKLEEEQARKREEARKKAEEEKKKKEAEEAKQRELVEKILPKIPSHKAERTDWSQDKIRAFMAEWEDVPVNLLFNTAFGFKEFPVYQRRDTHMPAIQNSLNTRLRKRRERDAEEKKVPKKK